MTAAKRTTSSQRYHAAFDQVIEVYLELHSSDGTIKKQELGKQDTTGDNPCLVKPSDQDFLCDVELAIKKVMTTQHDLDLLSLIVMTPQGLTYEDMAYTIETVGAEFIRRRIYPVKKYFAGKEVHRGTRTR